MIRVAIVGTGAISSSHASAYIQFSDRCKIVALADIYPEKAEALKEKFNLDAKVTDDYTQLLNDSNIDLVSVCTPPYTHASITIDFLNAGKHVIVEKPMASSLQECDDMIEAAAVSGKKLSVIAQNRFLTPVIKLKQVLDTKLMGKIVHAQVDSLWWRGHSYYDLWWRGTWEKEGGGCTINHAVHHIDMLQWMIGMPKEVQAFMANTSHDNAEVEDLSIAMLRFENGSLGQITSSVVHHGQEQQLVFQGEHARVSYPWKVKASKSKENGFPEPDLELEKKLQQMYDELPELSYQGHAGQIENVLTAIEQNKPVLSDGTAGRSTLELITAIYKSASTGEKATLPLSKQDPFYTREGMQQHAIRFYEKKMSVENFSDSSITLRGNY